MIIGSYQVICGSFTSSIGGVRGVQAILSAGGVVRTETPVDLVGGDIVEAVALARRVGHAGLEPAGAGSLQQGKGAEHVGLYKGFWIANRPVNMAFSSQMHDGIDRMRLHLLVN